MKTIIKLVIAVLLCAVDLSAGNTVTKSKDKFHLIVEGAFLNEKNVQYTIFKEDLRTGTFKSESRAKSRKYYYLSCDVGCRYIVRFENKKGDVKFLMIDASNAGYFGVNVDFSRSYDARIQYTKNGYDILPLTNSGLKPDIANNNGKTKNPY